MLLVNPAKCESMVPGNGRAWHGQRQWTLPATSGLHTATNVVNMKFKYLGVELHGNGDITRATGHTVASQAQLHGGFFAATTASTGSYGCEGVAIIYYNYYLCIAILRALADQRGELR
jgi:hypothetical protein